MCLNILLTLSRRKSFLMPIWASNIYEILDFSVKSSHQLTYEVLMTPDSESS